MVIPTVTLNTGAEMPALGLGTWPLDDGEAADAVVAAVEAGYRLFDTAIRYGNETGVGEGLRRSGVARDEVFVTTKLDGPFQGDDRAVGGLDASLERMGLDHVDLLLIHWPLPGRGLFVSTWQTFEKLYESGRARAIGVSNFASAHLDALAAASDVVPAVNQIQVNPRVQRRDQRVDDAARGIVTQSYGPLGGNRAPVLDEPVLADIGERYGRTAGQVVLRWHAQHGLVPLPKTSNPDRMVENAAVFDFELAGDEMVAIDALSRPGTGVDPERTGH